MSQASDFRVSVSSVDELDLVHEASLQWREYSMSGVRSSCMNALPHPTKLRLVQSHHSCAALILLMKRSTAATELMCRAGAVVAPLKDASVAHVCLCR